MRARCGAYEIREIRTGLMPTPEPMVVVRCEQMPAESIRILI